MALQTTSCGMNEGFSLHRAGNDRCGLDDLVSKIVDDEHLNAALLQEHAELFGLTLNNGMFTTSNSFRNISSPKPLLHMQCNNKQEFAAHCSSADCNNVGFLEKTTQAQHLGPNTSFNSSYDQGNCNLSSLNFENKMYEAQQHARNIFPQTEGNTLNYDDWETFDALQKADSHSDLFCDSDFRFSDLDNNLVCDPIDQQFWAQDFGKQVSEALNMATGATSWPPLSNTSFPHHTSNQINASVSTHSQLDMPRKQDREKITNGDVQSMMLSDSQYSKEPGPQNSTFKPISSASSSSSESQADVMTSTLGQNILNIANISEGYDAFTASCHSGIQGINSSSSMKGSISSLNRNGNLNQVSHAYQNFPRNLSSRYQNLQKSATSSQVTPESDNIGPGFENSANNCNYDDLIPARTGRQLNKSQGQRPHLWELTSTGITRVKPTEKHAVRACDAAYLEKTQPSDNEKPIQGAINSNRLPLSPEVLQNLSARTLAGLYAFGLYHDMLHTDINNCDGGSLALSPGMKYPSHLLSSSPIPESLFEVYHPYDFVHRRGGPSVYGTNDMFFDPSCSAFFSVPPTFIGMRPLRRSGPSNELHLRLEECYEQFRHLEKERKKPRLCMFWNV